ncbi:hypothetical protein SAY87_007487 [Trapa incisa]|uniref:Uncharacterized protein n=1 Tax=Trapa incisa TaxID=236973 RepID=A0AAN7QIA9_9MYRT|nr:hypothetical protein SAY87_007487 [Trapa incisa]
MPLLHYTNGVVLKHCFFSTTKKDELYLNLVLEYVPETAPCNQALQDEPENFTNLCEALLLSGHLHTSITALEYASGTQSPKIYSLFPGESRVDQPMEIFQVLGIPTREEIKGMNLNYREFKFPRIEPHPWHEEDYICLLHPQLPTLLMTKMSQPKQIKS